MEAETHPKKESSSKSSLDQNETVSTATDVLSRYPCCSEMWHYDGILEAKGYALLAMGRGVAVMSNVVVNAALLELAQQAAGCPTREEMKSLPDDYQCTKSIYGLNPLSFISNIAVATGVLAALFQPLIGVILDFTPYRKFVGILISCIFTCVQAAQIFIGERTWLAMAILQSLAGFCFTVMIMTTLAYLPEICEKVGQRKHETFTARFTAKQFTFQAAFLVLLGALSFGFGISNNSTQTARLSQAMNVALLVVLFGVGWRCMPSRPPARDLPNGLTCCGVLLYGLRQNVKTAKSIHKQYKKGLQWYLLATMFAQSAVGSLAPLSVVYLSSEVGLNATDISIFFLVVLIGTLPGSKIAPFMSKRTNPSTSWQLSMIVLFTVMAIGAFTLGNAQNKYLSLVWGFFVGVNLGWFYPTENMFFSFVNPKGSEAEIAGFRVYCSAILSWLPPLLFSILVEQGAGANLGLTVTASFPLIAAFLLRFCAGSWEEILAESGRGEAAANYHVEMNSLQPRP